ncbi:MAG TPA: dephospho-CoA kinase [Desulfatiglandales bacterium]|nr:dephospho-CoA kinase [Desulfatiglandales bacterium]
MLIVALTGGIGSGKSTVASMFKEEGAHVIDFDCLARLVVEPGKPAWRDIVDYFGERILSADQTLNRSALGEIVFSDANSREALEAFIHPRIFEETEALIKVIKVKDPFAVVIIDFPLLFELGLNKNFDKVILAYIPRDIQIERIIKRDGFKQEEIEKRLDAQIPIDEKKLLSDYLINTEGSLKDTRSQVRKIFHRLNELAKIEGGTDCL